MKKILVLLLVASGCVTNSNHVDCNPVQLGTKTLNYKVINQSRCQEPIFKTFQVNQNGWVVPNSGCSVEASSIPGVCETGFDVQCSVSGTTYELFGEFDDSGSNVAQYTVCHGNDCCEDEYSIAW